LLGVRHFPPARGGYMRSDMASLFKHAGISFRYPDSWRVEREQADGGWSVLLQSPGTAFLMVTFDENLPDAEEMAEAALVALREDYPTLDAVDRVETLDGRMAIGHDVSFISLDLTNTCWTRSFCCDAGTVLVLCQANDLELEEYGPVLRAVCSSLQVEE
jgi:hypothetical protein